MEPIVKMRGIKKSFPGVRALKGVDLTIAAGEVHGLIGENGAGKSVLLKTLLGALPRDGGDIYINGEPAAIATPEDGQRYGLGAVYQDIMLAPDLTVAENICLGRLPAKYAYVNKKELYRRTGEVLRELDKTIGLRERVRSLSIAKQQMVAIAKALYLDVSVLILDEPTAMLTGEETEVLFQVVRRLKESGVSIIYVSHRLEEVFAICDNITILRNGENVGDFATKDITRADMIKLMAGREVSETFDHIGTSNPFAGQKVLEVTGLTCAGKFKDVSFSVDKGEIVGFYGLVGAGRTEVMRAIFGADRYESGRIEINGREAAIRSVTDGIRAGIGLVPEDRRSQGAAVRMPVRTNINMAYYQKVSRLGFVSKAKERAIAQRYIDKLHIVTPGAEQAVQYLSGGNQQKVVISKWMNKHPDLLIFDEPTVGVDVGAKYEIYSLLQELAEEGMGVVFVSSYLPELMGVCHRIIVMNGGRITGELPRSGFDEETILDYAFRSEIGAKE